jgi:small-conductance mechanosensitive channel
MLQRILQKAILQNRVQDYLVAILIFIGLFIAIKIFRAIILRYLKKWAEKTATTLDDLLVKSLANIGFPLLYFGAIYAAVRTLYLSPKVIKVVSSLGFGVLTVLAILFSLEIIRYALQNYWRGKGIDATQDKRSRVILPVIKVLVWGLGVIFLLDNFGVKISALVAGLGIGGVAVAFALQKILGDLFSYFAILFDRPFEVGDFIIIQDYMGSVEHIGIKTTRLRSLGGEQLVFSNTDLTSSRLQNYKRMEKRRVVFRLGVTYQASLEQLKEIPKIIKAAIESVGEVAFDRAHFFSYGDFSLVFEVVYYVLSNDYTKYMDVQQQINFVIKEEFEKRGIEFAYPTQTLFITKQ